MTLNGSLNVIYVVCCVLLKEMERRVERERERDVSWQIWSRFLDEDLTKGLVAKVTVIEYKGFY